MKYIISLIVSVIICSCGDLKNNTPDQAQTTKITTNKNLPSFVMTNDTTKNKTRKAYLNYRGDIVLPIDFKDLVSKQKNGIYQPDTQEKSGCFVTSQKIASPNKISTIKVLLDAEINTQYSLGDTKEFNQKVLDVRFEYLEHQDSFSQQCHFSTNKMESKWLCTTKDNFQVYDATYNFKSSWEWKKIDSKDLMVIGPTLNPNSIFKVSLCNLRKSTFLKLRKIYLVATIDE